MWAVVESYAELARRVLDGPARLGRTRLVAVDGPSGAGKTVFAGRLAAALGAALATTGSQPPPGDASAGSGRRPPAQPPAHPPVVRIDDLLDGWADQVGFWPRLEEWVLAPLRAGKPGRYRRYDWRRSAFTEEWIPVPPAQVVIVEGVTAARALVRPELTCAVFVTAPSRLRLDRTLARDGVELLPDLLRWRRGERAHFADDGTAAHADLLVDGASDLAPDPATQYVRLRPAPRETGRDSDEPVCGADWPV